MQIRHLLLAALADCAVAATAPYLEADNFIRRVSHTSAVLGSWLYIDGGVLIYRDDGGNVSSILGEKTQAIDLSTSWTNSTVAIQEMSQDGPPSLYHSYSWVDTFGSTRYEFGGEIDASYGNTTLPNKTYWSFVPDNRGAGTWTEETGDSSYSNLVHPSGGSLTYGNGAAYLLGGHLSSFTYPKVEDFWQNEIGRYSPVSGFLQFNTTTGVWTNSSADGYSSDGIVHQGAAHFVPTFGPAGLVVFIGGQQSNTTLWTQEEPLVDMSDIAIFEPQSGKWYHQTASGDVPAGRKEHCAVGAAGENSTYEIFIWAGSSRPVYRTSDLNSTESASVNALDEVSVLSLPSFTWFKANYTPKASRHGHTCHLVGNRQLLSIGGIDPTLDSSQAGTQSDSLVQGLGIFDMTEMQWTAGYDANAAAYRSPDVVASHYRTNSRYPNVWNSSELQSIFGTINAATNGTNSNSTGPDNDNEHNSSHTGAIVGGVVGGVCAILIICGLIWVCLRRRRSRGVSAVPTEEAPPPQYTDEREVKGPLPHEAPAGAIAEMPVEHRHNELGTATKHEAWELPVGAHPSELPG